MGLLTLLQHEPSVEVIGEARTEERGLALLSELRPDILILDLDTFGAMGSHMIYKARKVCPGIKILVFSTDFSEQTMIETLAAQPDGYCLEKAIDENFLNILHRINRGDVWLGPNVSKLITAYAARNRKHLLKGSLQPSQKDQYLSAREQKVLALIAEGKSNAEIAEALSMSYHTIKADVSRILFKLSVPDRAQAAIKALQDRLV